MSKKALSILVAVLALALAAVGTLFVLEKSAGAQLSAEIESLTALAETQAGEIETLTAEAAARAAELESLPADAAEKDAAIESLTADLEQKAAELELLNAAIEELQAPADVEDAFDATRAFLQRCEAEGLRCEYHGADADGDDCITVKQSGLIPFTVRVWFSGGNPTAPYLVWQYIRFSAIDRAPVLELCNLLNKEYTDMTFLVDDWDNSVSVRGMLPVSGQDTEDGDGFAAFRRMLDVMEENEEHFLPYAQ